MAVGESAGIKLGKVLDKPSKSARAPRQDQIYKDSEPVAIRLTSGGNAPTSILSLRDTRAPEFTRRTYRREIRAEHKEKRHPSPASPGTQGPAEAVSSPAPVAGVSKPLPQDTHSLAQRYVEQFEKNAGVTLSSAEFQARVENVYNFYSDPSRSGRLAKIVFA